jgi:frataxin-like iron-binding protein CyaY
MASNHKLSALLKGRRITGTSNQNDMLTIHFDDGSTMTVKTAGSSNSASTGSAIAAVRQQDMTLHLDFENNSTMTIQTAEPTASVMVRDKNNTMEYAD